MGNAQSNNNNNNKKKTFEQIIDYVASNYILTQNFKDMENLSNMDYCNKLVILTSKIVEKNLTDLEIAFLAQRLQKGVEINQMDKDNLTFFEKKDFEHLDVNNKTQKRRMCIGIAKFYVKIAHVFAAIVTTINPIFKFKGNSNENVPMPNAPMPLPMPDAHAPMPLAMPNAHAPVPMPIANAHAPVSAPIVSAPIVPAPIVPAPIVSAPIVPNANAHMQDEEGEALISGGDNEQKVDITQKHNIPENASVNIDRINICSKRINALLNGENYMVDSSKSIKVQPKFCDIKDDSLSSESGIPELEKLYFDKYDYDNGGFVGMTDKMRKEVYEKDVIEFYKVFTGINTDNPVDEQGKPIKTFSQIKLHNYSKLEGCKVNGSLNKPYTGTLKESLFAKYAEHIKTMVEKAKKSQQNLLAIIDRLFEFVYNEDTQKKEIIIKSDLTEQGLNKVVEDTRKIIIELYVNCELDFSEGLKNFEDIVYKTIKDTTIAQIKNIETDKNQILYGNDSSSTTSTTSTGTGTSGTGTTSTGTTSTSGTGNFFSFFSSNKQPAAPAEVKAVPAPAPSPAEVKAAPAAEVKAAPLALAPATEVKTAPAPALLATAAPAPAAPATAAPNAHNAPIETDLGPVFLRKPAPAPALAAPALGAHIGGSRKKTHKKQHKKTYKK